MGVQGEKRDDSESTYDECELFLRAGRACHQGHCITSRVNVAHYVVAGLGLALLDAKRGCGVPGRLQHVALGIARLGLCRQREPGSFGCVFEQVLALTRSYPPPVVQQDAYVLRNHRARSDSSHIVRAGAVPIMHMQVQKAYTILTSPIKSTATSITVPRTLASTTLRNLTARQH